MVKLFRQSNFRNMLIRAKVPIKPRAYPERKIKGMVKCGKQCPACPFIMEEKVVSFSKKRKQILNRKLSCENSNVIYMIECHIVKRRGTLGRQEDP